MCVEGIIENVFDICKCWVFFVSMFGICKGGGIIKNVMYM